MSERERSLEQTALRLMCRADTVTRDEFCALPATDMSQVCDWATEHRFAACLHHSLGQAGLRQYLPPDLRDRLAAAYKRSTLRALSMQRDMLKTSSILDRAGIPHLFMKGAYLAQFAYPELGLRPLRDLDVLVPQDSALAAFEALLASGLERKPPHMGDPAAHLAERKHLPPVRFPGGATVEVHTRTISASPLLRPGSGEGVHAALSSRQVTRDVAGSAITFEGPENLLLHLSVHAAIDHRFDNGPLILSDVGWMLETHSIDWNLLWRLAETQGATRGLALVLRLVEREWPRTSIDWPTETARILPADDPVIAVAGQSLLRSVKARGDVALQAELESRQTSGSRLGELLRRAFPRRIDLATEVPVRADSPWILAWYPVKWWRLRLRLAAFIRSRFDPRARQDAIRLGTLNRWLRG